MCQTGGFLRNLTQFLIYYVIHMKFSLRRVRSSKYLLKAALFVSTLLTLNIWDSVKVCFGVCENEIF